jgi:protein-tyrosine kinase
VSGELAHKLVLTPQSDAVLSEYRRLALALDEARKASGIKIVQVTSAAPHEGKTLTAVNLALTLSETFARRVLLVDANFGSPKMHELFFVSSGSGLADHLASGGAGEAPVMELTPHLSFMQAGSSPVELGTGDGVRAALLRASVSYEWVILDSAPISAGDQPVALARSVGAVLLVVDATCSADRVARTVDAVGRERVLGVVVNRAAIAQLA